MTCILWVSICLPTGCVQYHSLRDLIRSLAPTPYQALQIPVPTPTLITQTQAHINLTAVLFLVIGCGGCVALIIFLIVIFSNARQKTTPGKKPGIR